MNTFKIYLVVMWLKPNYHDWLALTLKLASKQQK